MAQAFTVTASTSVVQISSILTPYTVVLLSSIRYPGHIVGIRDVTGNPAITANPIVVSTTQGIRFYDGTISTLINQPFGSLSLTSKSPTTWQILNNAGFFTSLSNAYLSTLTASYSYINLISSVKEVVSSVVVEQAIITNSINILGNTEIQGDITVSQNVDFFSSMTSYQPFYISSATTFASTFVNGSSLSIKDNVTVGGNLSTIHSLSVKDSLTVNQEVFANGALLPKHLSVLTLKATSMNVGGGLQSATTVSTQSNFSLSDYLLIQKSTTLVSNAVINGSFAVADNLYGVSNLTSFSLSTLGIMSVTKEICIGGTLSVAGSVSTFGNVNVNRVTYVNEQLLVKEDVCATELSRFQTLDVLGSANISSFEAFSGVNVLGDALSYGKNFTTTTFLETLGDVGTGFLTGNKSYLSISTGISSLSNLGVGDSLSIGGILSVRENMYVGDSLLGISSLQVSSFSTQDLIVSGDLTVLGNITVRNLFAASTIGAPIDLAINTLTLSNTFYVKDTGKIPLLDTNAYPNKMVVGEGDYNNEDICVNGVLVNLSTVQQNTLSNTQNLWVATNLYASTLATPSLLSSFTIGADVNTKPLQTFHGAILTGTFPTPNNLFYSSNVSSSYTTVNPTSYFKGAAGGNKVAYNGSYWVAVGNPSIPALREESILRSLDGYTWNPVSSGGFALGGTNVLYAGGQWIATGSNQPPNATIQISLDGDTWYNTSNAFNPFLNGYGTCVAYNGSNRWVATGSELGITGIKYSDDGFFWSDATLFPPLPFAGESVGYGNGRWNASDGVNRLITSTDGAIWILQGFPLGILSFAHNGVFWVAGAVADSFNPVTSILVSIDGLAWFPILSGGFTDRCTDVKWDSTANLWLATGYTNPQTTQILQCSTDGINWTPVVTTDQIAQGRGIGVGTIRAPDTDPYFMNNLTTIMRYALSSSVLSISSAQVSSIQSPSFFGDGAGVTNVGSFRPYIYTSSLLAYSINGLDISAERFESQFMTVENTLDVFENSFLSSVNFWVAAGFDSQSNGNIQTGFTGSNWIRGVGTNFNTYGKAVTGNGNISSPVYVAVGADTRTEYTIQWSQDARSWNPITTGGFDIAQDGIRLGNSVAYSKELGTWVAAGNNLGTTSTLFYSYDASNWYCATNGFADTTRFVATALGQFIALGDGVKFSFDGITWNDSPIYTYLDTVGFGLTSINLLTQNAWLGTQNKDLYVSYDGVVFNQIPYTTLEKVTSLVYSTSNWVAVGCNTIQYSSTGTSWATVTTQFAPDTIFNAVAYNSNLNKWVAGAVSTTADKSLWSSDDLQTWSPSVTGGFSTTILGAGAGYGVFTSSFYTYAAGTGSFSGVTILKPNILQVQTNGAGSYKTSDSLTQANSSNVFQSEVRAIAGSINETYAYVAVGDGEVPQKTIARSLNTGTNNWLPAITGGFSTVGYGITHYDERWVAVGDAQAASNVIQYSPDGANWFGTNNTSTLRQGGRGIAKGIGALTNTIVAVGKDQANSTIVGSLDGYSWTPGTGSYFTVQGNGVAGGSNGVAPNFVAVGQDSRGFRSTILRSEDGFAWSNVLSGGFTGAGYGVAFGLANTYVAVGFDTNPSKTIQYSSDGGANFSPVLSGAFTQAGYGVAFNTLSNVFFAVGEDSSAQRNRTIKYSGDGFNWSNISTGSGFISQTTLGAGYGLYTQEVLVTERIPYLEFSNLIVYERIEPLPYSKPTIRVQSTFLEFNESLFINISSQVVIGSNVPYNQSTVMSVYGNIYASSFLYTGSAIPNDYLRTSSLIVSTLSSFNTLDSIYLTTPSFAFNTSESKPNNISSYADILSTFVTNMLTVNETLYTSANLPIRQATGIANATPLYDLDVGGSFAASSFSTSFAFIPGCLENSGAVVHDPYLSIYSGPNVSVANASNLLFATPSSLTVNSIVNFNLSSQRIGIYTDTPQFSLDVRRQAYVQSLSTPRINTSLLFLTLQSA